MGNHKSKTSRKDKIDHKKISDDKTKNYKLVEDRFGSYNDLEEGLKKAGLEACQLIVGIDFTKSNTWQGGDPNYFCDNLHDISTPSRPNPYQQVLSIMCNSLAAFDDDGYIDTFGFGDHLTTDKSVFSFYSDTNGHDQPCVRLTGVLERYNQLVPMIQMSGPTSFAPIIRKAIQIVRERKQYHILIIIADGAVDNIGESVDAIIEASKHPLSIVCIGVGKGPWEKMIMFDDNIPQRDFDNFQFVNFHEMMHKCENVGPEFAKNALMEIPDQYSYIKQHIL